jgi:phosphoribosylanthranilate isomerase
MIDVKFCGMTRASDVAKAAELGARYVGCILAESPRRVGLDRARELADEAVRNGIGAFGVIATDEIDDVLAVVSEVPLAGVQLQGRLDDTALERLREHFGGELWLVSRVGPVGLADGVRRFFELADGVVLDTYSPRALGGTGEKFNWREVARELASLAGTQRARIIVAGGLRPENVAEAVSILHPDVVDVSSGVESSPGIKDHERMRAFVDAMRAILPPSTSTDD